MATARDLIFGAKPHDPAFWRAHPMVADVEGRFDGDAGCWVDLKLKRRRLGPSLNVVRETDLEAVQDNPDLYFWGEGDCPLDLFEHAPGVREARFWIQGPIEGDDRTCWSVGLWIAR